MIDLHDMIKKNDHILALIGSLKSDSGGETIFKLELVREMLTRLSSKSEVSLQDLMAAMTGSPVPFGEVDVERALESTRMVEKKDSRTFRIRPRIELKELFPDLPEGLECDMNRFGRALSKLYEPELARQAPSLRECLEAIHRSSVWALEIVSTCIQRKLDGIPTFFNCYGDGNHIPVGFTPGAFATFDLISMLFEPARYRFRIADVIRPTDIPCVAQLLSYGLSFRKTIPGWNKGGIHPGQDLGGSDFPTVDSTGVAVSAWSQFYGYASEGDLIVLRDMIEEPLRSAKDFILRMQNTDGSWSIYRYEHDQYSMIARVYSCQRALMALSNATAARLFSNADTEKMRRSAEDCYDFVIDHAKTDGDTACWDDQFSTEAARPSECVLPTARILQALVTSCLAWEPPADVIHVMESGLRFLLENWEPDPNNVFRSETRLPTKEGPSDQTFKWENKIDPLVLPALLQYCKEFDVNLSSDQWRKVDSAISDILPSEYHGHWNNPDPNPANQWAFPSLTYLHSRALRIYVWYVFHSTRKAFEQSTNGPYREPSMG